MDRKDSLSSIKRLFEIPKFSNGSVLYTLLNLPSLNFLKYFLSTEESNISMNPNKNDEESLPHKTLQEYELELKRQELNCSKNPGHLDFIPIKSLTTEHLDAEYKSEKISESVRCLAQLTVQVKMTIDEKCRIGTGKVIDVLDNTTDRKCPCSRCNSSDLSKPSDVWWSILVLTSSNVVFDEQEAMHATCRLFYDNADAPVVTVDGRGLVRTKGGATTEVRTLVCVTCDRKIVDRLNKAMDSFTVLYEGCFDKFWDVNSDNKMLVMVSHPHGLPQMVSIGRTQDKLELSEDCNILTYSTCTCPGSAGAFLYIL